MKSAEELMRSQDHSPLLLSLVSLLVPLHPLEGLVEIRVDEIQKIPRVFQRDDIHGTTPQQKL
jgi:hypothetical protein